MPLVNTLKEIPEECFKPLLDDLKSDFPNSIHILSFLRSIERRKATDSTVIVKILALNGDYRSRFILFYTAPSDLSDITASAHKWSHKDEDEDVIREALMSENEFPWTTSGKAQLTALTDETSRVIYPFVKELWKDVDAAFEIGHYVYWMPREEALNLEFDVPKGTYLSNLTPHHAKEIDEHWPHRYDGSQKLIESAIKFNFGVGLFNSDTHELMTSVIQWFYGGIGALHTKTHHQRKGYGAVVLKAITREIAKRGDDVHLNVVPDNVVARTLMEKIKYQLIFRSTWLFKF